MGELIIFFHDKIALFRFEKFLEIFARDLANCVKLIMTDRDVPVVDIEEEVDELES